MRSCTGARQWIWISQTGLGHCWPHAMQYPGCAAALQSALCSGTPARAAQQGMRGEGDSASLSPKGRPPASGAAGAAAPQHAPPGRRCARPLRPGAARGRRGGGRATPGAAEEGGRRRKKRRQARHAAELAVQVEPRLRVAEGVAGAHACSCQSGEGRMLGLQSHLRARTITDYSAPGPASRGVLHRSVECCLPGWARGAGGRGL